MGRKKVVMYELMIEKFIKLTDRNYKEITNDKAKLILGQYWHVPRCWAQRVMNDIVKCGYIKRKSQDVLEIHSEIC